MTELTAITNLQDYRQELVKKLAKKVTATLVRDLYYTDRVISDLKVQYSIKTGGKLPPKDNEPNE